MKDSEVIRCTKCNAELHPEFVPPVNIMEHYYCPKCAKEIKKFMKIEEQINKNKFYIYKPLERYIINVYTIQVLGSDSS